MFKIVEFQSENATLRGRLYVCPGTAKRLPDIIMAHGFSATINGMVADNYAEAFCQAGLVVSNNCGRSHIFQPHLSALLEWQQGTPG